MPNNGHADVGFSPYGLEPPPLDIETMKGEAIDVWHAKWKGYVAVSGLATATETNKINVLYQCLSTPTLQLLLTIVPEPRSLDATVTELVEHIKGKVNVVLERKRLFERKQRPEEGIKEFVTALKAQMKLCAFEAEKDNILTTVFIVGIRDPHTIEAILALEKPKLKDAINMALVREAATTVRCEVQGNKDGGQLGINQMSKGGKSQHGDKTRGGHKTPSNQSNSSSGTGPPCPWCGNKSVRHEKTSCPAANVTCHACNKKGHFQRVCRSGSARSPNLGARQLSMDQQQQLLYIQQQQSLLQHQQQQLLASPQTHGDMGYEDASVSHIYGVMVQASCNSAEVEKAPRMYITCESKEGLQQRVEALPDTGADISAAGLDLMGDLNVSLSDLIPTTLAPKAANGNRMTVFGVMPVTWISGDKSITDSVYIIDGTETPLLSWRVVKELGFLSNAYPGGGGEQGVQQMAAVSGDDEDDEEFKKSPEGRLVQELDAKLSDEYKDVFSEEIKVMKGDDFKIVLKADAEPKAYTAPRPVPLALRQGLREELDALQNRDIIEPVTHPTDWCSPIVIEPKTSGEGVRVCIDMTDVNRYVKREWYVSDPPHIAVSTIPMSAKYFTTLDATKGYHQCLLDEESRDVTTFITPFGRFRYKRAPFGLSSISEHYNRRMDEALVGIDDYKRATDDILLHDKGIEEQYQHARQLLQRCREQGITLSRSKFKFCRRKVKFAGYIVTQGSYTLDTDITDAIAKFPTPTTRTQLRSFVGLVNQLSSSTSSIAPLLKDLRPLLSTKNEFMWDRTHDRAFQTLREVMAKAPEVAYFQLGKPIRVLTDASRQGLGFVLQQCVDGEWRMVQAGSRMLTAAESRYAVIELELLAVCFAIKKAAFYVRGYTGELVIKTDHKPLVGIINHKNVHDVDNPRLSRMKQFLMPFQLKAEYLPGKDNDAADALSRSPVGPPVVSAISNIHLSPVHLLPQDRDRNHEALAEEAAKDSEYQQLKHLITREGFPANKSQLQVSLRPFWHLRESLSSHGETIFVGTRVLVPRSMRPRVLQSLHASHQGIVRTQERARATVYWPGIDNDIENAVQGCQKCQYARPANQKQPMVQRVRPQYPGQHMAADLFEANGAAFIAVTDVYSTWPEVARLSSSTHGVRSGDTSSVAVARVLDEIWSRLGIPEVLYTDGGPQFTAHSFKVFTQERGVRHIVSAPTYAQSNAHAEAAVKVVKQIILKNSSQGKFDDAAITVAMRQYRNTPNARDGLSPAQKMMGRPIRDEVTFVQQPRVTARQREEAAERAKQYDARIAKRYDESAKPLHDLTCGDEVLVWSQALSKYAFKAVVVNTDGRRVRIRGPGGVLERDRRHLLKVPKRAASGWSTSQSENGHGRCTGSQTRQGGPPTSLSLPWTTSPNNRPSSQSPPTPTGQRVTTAQRPPHQTRILIQPPRLIPPPRIRTERPGAGDHGRSDGAHYSPPTEPERGARPKTTRKQPGGQAQGKQQSSGPPGGTTEVAAGSPPRSYAEATAAQPPRQMRIPIAVGPPHLAPPRTPAPPVNIDPAARTRVARTPPPAERAAVNEGAPKKQATRTMIRQHFKRREARENDHDGRRLGVQCPPQRLQFQEQRPMTWTEAIGNAFQVVRRSNRIRRPPERFRDS